MMSRGHDWHIVHGDKCEECGKPLGEESYRFDIGRMWLEVCSMECEASYRSGYVEWQMDSYHDR